MGNLEPILLPIRLFRVPAARRDEASLRNAAEHAAEIWAQTGIKLQVAPEIVELAFDLTRTIAKLLDSEDGGSIAVFAVPSLQGANGLSRRDTKRIVIADATTVPAGRVLAHEIEHILIGSAHPLDPNRLMANGRHGTQLTRDETQQARATVLSIESDGTS